MSLFNNFLTKFNYSIEAFQIQVDDLKTINTCILNSLNVNTLTTLNVETIIQGTSLLVRTINCNFKTVTNFFFDTFINTNFAMDRISSPSFNRINMTPYAYLFNFNAIFVPLYGSLKDLNLINNSRTEEKFLLLPGCK